MEGNQEGVEVLTCAGSVRTDHAILQGGHALKKADRDGILYRASSERRMVLKRI